jgi:hypothetical protein
MGLQHTITPAFGCACISHATTCKPIAIETACGHRACAAQQCKRRSRQLVASLGDKLSIASSCDHFAGATRRQRIRAVIDIPEHLRPLFLAPYGL